MVMLIVKEITFINTNSQLPSKYKKQRTSPYQGN